MTQAQDCATSPLGARATPSGSLAPPLLEVEDLQVEIRLRRRLVHAVNGLSYSLKRGETLAVLGESGSGKTMAAHAVMGTLPTRSATVTAGKIRLDGSDLLGLPERERRRLRGRRMAIIFQDSLSALNPVFTVGNQIGEMFRFHTGMSRRAAERAALEVMERVGIPAAHRRLYSYPHEFSGGMRQRVMIAMAIALNPDLLIADEPTTALDVTVQAQIMDLLRRIQAETGMGLVLITHDLGVVAEMADRAVVMYAGRAVEESPAAELYRRPAHPYTVGLLRSIPRLDRPEEELRPIPGAPPDMSALPTGCSFHPRCRWARERCASEAPASVSLGAGRRSACHFASEVVSGRGSPERE